jgi:hypothetical protein
MVIECRKPGARSPPHPDLFQEATMHSSFKKFSRVTLVAAAIGATFAAAPAFAQTAFGASNVVTFPVVASTASFTSVVTLYNPNTIDVTVGLSYFDANNTDVPGPKTCPDVSVPSFQSVELKLASACDLGNGSHFGQLTATESSGTATILGYSRVENTQGSGFSVEGFPSANFATTQTLQVTGLKGSTGPAPVNQSNCFVSSQGTYTSYYISLFDGTTGAQIGINYQDALSGGNQQVRYLDVFQTVQAPADTDFTNVRAQFTRTDTSSPQSTWIAFCTVQDNATMNADFRIAKPAMQLLLN